MEKDVKCYACGTGLHQSGYDRLLDAVEAGMHSFARRNALVFAAYRKYYADGTMPHWASRSEAFRVWCGDRWRLSPEGEDELERRMDRAVSGELARMIPGSPS